MSSASRRLRLVSGSVLAACALLFAAPGSAGASEAVLYRLFLVDGSTLVSYGEFARVGDGVVLSLPLGEITESPVLQLVTIPESTVDWERTNQYSNAVRAQRFGETRGETDFAFLTAHVAGALNQIALTQDPARRLAMAREARGNLARWPSENFGYRAADIAQLTGMLDEVISELRAGAGERNFDLTLVANRPLPSPRKPPQKIGMPNLRSNLSEIGTRFRSNFDALPSTANKAIAS